MDVDSDGPRLGWFVDGLPEQISPSRPAMLHTENGQAVVTMLFEHGAPLSQYFHDSPMTDPPELELPTPTTGYFVDPSGSVALAGARYSPGIIGVGRTGRIDFRFAVRGGSGLGYDRINGLATAVEGLAEWLDVARPVVDPVLDEEGRTVGATVTATVTPAIPLARRENLRAVPRWSVVPRQRQWNVDHAVRLVTSGRQGREWQQHIVVHRLVLDLLTIAADAELGVSEVEVMARHDPPSMTRGSPWRTVTTTALPEPRHPRDLRFLFTYGDVGSVGVHRWLELGKGRFHGALDVIRGVFRPRGTYLESQVGLAAIAVEKTGHLLGVEAEHWQLGERSATFEKCAREIAAVAPGVARDSWAAELTLLNKGLKHPDKPEASAAELVRCLKETKRVLRAWVAVRLGLPAPVAVKRLGEHQPVR